MSYTIFKNQDAAILKIEGITLVIPVYQNELAIFKTFDAMIAMHNKINEKLFKKLSIENFLSYFTNISITPNVSLYKVKHNYILNAPFEDGETSKILSDNECLYYTEDLVGNEAISSAS